MTDRSTRIDPAPQADFIVAGATLIDGSGGPSRQGDLAVRDGRIVALGDFAHAPGVPVIDARGLALAPGFIDSHTHDDGYLLAHPEMLPKVSQGITTVVTGNCGISLAPLAHANPPAPLDLLDEGGSYHFKRFADYLEALRATPAAVNAACMVGHSTLRAAVMPDLQRAATDDEIDAMRALAEEAMASGAIGISTGAFYPPATHMRDEGEHIVAALEETFRIGRELDVPVVISHHKVMGQPNFGRSRETLPLIEAAMARQDVSLDAYPYVAGSTMLKQDRVLLAGRTIITWCKPFPELSGRDLDEVAAERGKSKYDVVPELQPAGAIYFMMDEPDVQRILAFGPTMIGSDGLPHDERPHPRLWGTFPRVLGHYARDLGLFPLETAVWKMTGLTAERFGLAERGQLRPGYFADLVVFDPATVADTATFERPTERAAGIHSVYVNGVPVWREQAFTGEHAGRVLARTPA